MQGVSRHVNWPDLDKCSQEMLDFDLSSPTNMREDDGAMDLVSRAVSYSCLCWRDLLVCRELER